MQTDRHLVNIALIGFMGTGKTSVGRLVADQLRFDYLDTDELIQTATGKTISDIFKTDGEKTFRANSKKKSWKKFLYRERRRSSPPAAVCR